MLKEFIMFLKRHRIYAKYMRYIWVHRFSNRKQWKDEMLAWKSSNWVDLLTWSDTHEGYEYWNNIDDLWRAWVIKVRES